MTQTDTPTVDNGVNVEALRGAREALTMHPEAASFQWRAELRVGARHPQPLDDHRLLRPRRRARAPSGVHGRRRPPRGLRLRGQRCHPARDRARGAGIVSHGRCRDGGHRTATSSSMLGEGDRQAGMDLQGILGIDGDVRNGFDRDHRDATTSTRMRVGRTSRRFWPSPRSARPSSTSSPTRPPSRSPSPERAAVGIPSTALSRRCERRG